VGPSAASAEQYVPTRFNDPTPNGCKPDDCSLREAIKAANNHGGRDTVILSSGTYKMQIPASSGASIEDGDFNIYDDLTIKGQGPKKTEVDGKGVDRVFAAAGKTKFLKMTITGGDSSMDPQHTSIGGGIAAFGDKLVLKSVLVSDNDAQLGGGISSIADELSIVKSTVFGNRAVEGGGLDLRSAITQPVTNIRASTFEGNSATQKGGGILADGANFGPNSAEPFLIVENSTFANNVAGGGTGTPEGGGILGDNGAIVSLEQTTLYLNRASNATATAGIGGGLYQHSGAIFNPGDSIIYGNSVGSGGNTRSNVAGSQCAGTFNGSGGNLVHQLVGTACTITGGYTETSDAKFGDPGNYGGPTLVIPLLAGSPAIGLAGSCPPKDQRGVARPTTDCDSGAFENTDP
jgi:CSLREA domain-containing protein